MFPNNGYFRHLVSSQTYTLETRTRPQEFDVIDLTCTWSPPIEPAAAPSTSSRHMPSLQAGHCYICIGVPAHPVTCLHCHNIIGCLKCILNMSEYDKRCPLCKEESTVLACAAYAASL